MNYLKTTILGLAVALGSAFLVQRGAAQGLVEACYVNKTGVLYVINQPGLPTECRSPGHTYVSWSQQGIQGPKGDEGTAGLSCWDLDGDGVQDPDEDVNGDQSFNALDCRGPQGLPGAAGMLGAVTFAAATNQVRPPSSFSTLLTTSFTTAADGPAVISFFANAAKLDGASEHTGLLFRLMIDGNEVVSGNRLRNDFESPYRDAQMYGFDWPVNLVAGSHTVAVEWVGLCESGQTGCATMDARSLIVRHGS